MMSAKDKKKGALVPRLRFPEFQDAGEWAKIQLSKIAIPVSERATDGDADAVLTLSAEHGVVTQGAYFGKKVAGDDVRRYIRIKNNDFVYNDRTTKLYKYGTIKRLSRHAYGIVSPIYKCFRFNHEEIPVFWEWYFESGEHDAQIHSIINEGAKEGRFNISIQKFLSIFVYFPKRLEQQRITDCLSSLDERITTETSKLDTLKDHKKGLLKQLFPAEGETLPQLRFPEFQDAGEWNKTRLNNCVSIHAGLNVEQVNYPTDYKVTRIETISTQKIDNYKVGYIHPFQGMTAYKLNVGDILFSNINSIEHIGKSVFIDKDYGIYHGMNLLRLVATSQPRIAKFLFYYINTSSVRESFRRRANKAVNQASINQTELGKTVIYIPIYKKEQQRIADCLSSLDELIAAQTQKINLLKDHKKGLMQQLFPVLNEAQV